MFAQRHQHNWPRCVAWEGELEVWTGLVALAQQLLAYDGDDDDDDDHDAPRLAAEGPGHLRVLRWQD
jgi:hypothetical protein